MPEAKVLNFDAISISEAGMIVSNAMSAPEDDMAPLNTMHVSEIEMADSSVMPTPKADVAASNTMSSMSVSNMMTSAYAEANMAASNATLGPAHENGVL